MASNLPISRAEILRNMQAAVPARRGDLLNGASFVRIDHRSGAITYGKDSMPLPLEHEYTAPWREFQWGYKDFVGRNVTSSVLQPVCAGPCPMPPGNAFTSFGVDGPRACMELRLCSITEPGFAVVYSCLNESGTSRILDLWGQIAAQYSVNETFANPVVRVGPDSYTNQYGTTFVMTYDVGDWLSDDGTTLLSTVEDLDTSSPF
jgi:hypothetical protein